MQALVVASGGNELTWVNRALRSSGLALHEVESADAAVDAWRGMPVDVIVLGKQDGISRKQDLQALRSSFPKASIIVVSPDPTSADRAAHLNAGADDHVGDTIDPGEFSFRINAMVRRRYGHAASSIVFGEITVNLDARVAACNETPLKLTEGEYNILASLVLARGGPVSDERLLHVLRLAESGGSESMFNVRIHRLRAKVRAASSQRMTIIRRRGVGLVLTVARSGASAKNMVEMCGQA